MKKEYDEVEPKPTKNTEIVIDETKSLFDGKFLDYIGYKLLALIITIVTFTIAKPWADKLILEYKINHTRYNGKKLKFEGTGTSLFVQRFKWYFFTIITLGIYGLWIPIKMEKWIASNTHFADEALNETDSYFDGKLIQLLGINLFTYFLTLISFGLLFPFAHCYKQKWIAKHTVINCKKIVFNGKALSLIGHYLLWYLLSIITVGIYGLWLPMKVYGWQVKNTHIKLKDEDYDKPNFLPIFLGIILAILFISLLVAFIPKLEIPAIVSGDKHISEIFDGFKKDVSQKPSVNENNQATIKWDSDGGNISTNDSYTIGDTIDELETPTKEGYIFIKWVDQNGNEVKKGYIITGELTITAVWQKVTAPSENKPNNNNNESQVVPSREKCNTGFLYDDYTNKCLDSSDYAEPWTEDIYDEEGNILASGIKCPDNYLISWDLEPAGYCFKLVNPNY